MTRGRLTIMDRVKNMAEEKRHPHNAITEESDPPRPGQGEELGGSSRIPALLKRERTATLATEQNQPERSKQ